jgi:NNP family nitrate/nitrite transporter-like MFS transporter
MGSLLFPLFKLLFGGSCYGNCGNNENENDGDDSFGEYDRASDLAWRTVMVFPAILSLYTAWAVVRYGDDTPKGNVSSLRKRRRPPTNDDDNAAGSRRYQQEKTIQDSFRQGAANVNTWLLFIQYGCCFGVEITMTQGAALYFHEEFGQSTESAAAIASVFGWMNLFARGIGGFFSDMANAKAGLRGRLWVQVVMLLLEGAFVINFSYTSTLGGAIVVLAFFSIFVQAAEGSTFGIVPYIDSAVTGSVAGLVGAGGNFGGAGFAYLLVHFDYRNAFLWMGSIVMASSLWTMFFAIPGHRSLLTGRDADEIVRHRHQAKLPAVVVFEIHGDAAEVSERIVSEREMEDEQDEEDGF